MQRKAAILLQAVIVCLGLGVLALMLWEPHLEGRNAHATFFQIYFQDPFLAYAYVASIWFFVALYQACKVLGYAGRKMAFSPEAVQSVRTIKHCALAIIGFVVVGEIFILLDDSDDRAGGVFMGVLITFAAVVTAAVAAMFERSWKNSLALKSRNNLAA